MMYVAKLYVCVLSECGHQGGGKEFLSKILKDMHGLCQLLG